MINIEDLSVSYGSSTNEWILKGLDLKINDTYCVGLIGKNGSGKTTLAHALIGIIPEITKGIVKGAFHFNKYNLFDRDINDRLKYIAYTFQDVESQILFGNVSDVIGLNEKNNGRELIERAIELLKIQHLLNRNPHELSGGEIQRVALASTFRVNPELIIYDEATSALDPILKRDFFELIQYLKKINKSILMMGQRPEILFLYTDENFELIDGTISKHNGSEESGADGYEREYEFWDEVEKMNESQLEYLPKLSIKDLQFRRKKGVDFLLNIQDLIISPGERIALLGVNGSGKSTLLALLNGLLLADRFLFKMDGREYTSLKKSRLGDLIKIVYHSPTSQIIGTKIEEELFGFQQINSEIQGLLEQHFPFLESGKDPLNLSFGQQRILCMLSAFLSDKPILLIDEPEYGVDYHYLKYIKAYMLKNRRNKALIFSTHDLELAAQIADRCFLMCDGTIVSEIKSKSTEEVRDWFFKNSKH